MREPSGSDQGGEVENQESLESLEKLVKQRTGGQKLVLIGFWIFVSAAIVAGGYFAYVQFRLHNEDEKEEPWAHLDGDETQSRLLDVHRELLPKWQAAYTDEGVLLGDEWTVLREEIPNDELRAALETMRFARLQSDGMGFRNEFRQAIRRWNTSLRDEGHPWTIRGTTGSRSLRMFFTFNYFVPHRGYYTHEGHDDIIMEFGNRADAFRVISSYMGHYVPGDDAAIVQLDRVAEAALNIVWPALAREHPNSELNQHFSPILRDELRQRLPEEDWEVLTETAGVRRELVSATRALQESRSCQRLMQLPFIPLRGFDLDLINQIRSAGQKNRTCRRMVREHLSTIEDRSLELKRKVGLTPAFERLLAILAEDVAHHEARHVLDDRNGLDCDTEICDRIGEAAQVEFSAFFTQLLSSEQPYTQLFMMCQTLEQRSAPRRYLLGIYYLVRDTMGDDCLAAPPDDLKPVVRAFRDEMFGHRADLAMTKPIPDRLPFSLR